MGKRYSSRAPLRDEAAVRELLALMEEYNAPGRKELAAMVAQITGLERQLDEASRQIEAMRKELAEVREGPVKRTLTKAVRALERGAALLGERLDDLKAAVVDGCKRTLAAVRERGISTLANGPLVNDWYSHEDRRILCCTDGVRPVIYELALLDEDTTK